MIIFADRIYTDIKSGLNAGIVSILVMSGETDEKILNESIEKPDIVLKDAGLINNELAFSIKARLSSASIMPGTYKLTASMSADDMLAWMSDQDNSVVKQKTAEELAAETAEVEETEETTEETVEETAETSEGEGGQ